jgi:hypothetical protein
VTSLDCDNGVFGVVTTLDCDNDDFVGVTALYVLTTATLVD